MRSASFIGASKQPVHASPVDSLQTRAIPQARYSSSRSREPASAVQAVRLTELPTESDPQTLRRLPASNLLPSPRTALAETAQVLGKLLEAGEIVDRHEVVDERKRGLNPPGQRLVFRCAEEGVEPDEPPAAALEPGDLLAQHARLAAVPAVADHERQRAVTQHPPSPLEVERPESLADACAARPVGNDMRDLAQCPVEIPFPQLPRDARQPRAEYERFHLLLESAGQPVSEQQQEARVALHRSADVGDDHQRPRLDLWRTLCPVEDLTTVSEVAANRAPEIEQAAVAGPPARGLPFSDPPYDLGHQDPHGLDLLPCQLAEVLLPENLPFAVGERRLQHW